MLASAFLLALAAFLLAGRGVVGAAVAAGVGAGAELEAAGAGEVGREVAGDEEAAALSSCSLRTAHTFTDGIGAGCFLTGVGGWTETDTSAASAAGAGAGAEEEAASADSVAARVGEALADLVDSLSDSPIESRPESGRRGIVAGVEAGNDGDGSESPPSWSAQLDGIGALALNELLPVASVVLDVLAPVDGAAGAAALGLASCALAPAPALAGEADRAPGDDAAGDGVLLGLGLAEVLLCPLWFDE